MPRWEHGSDERLKRVAVELFDERGFEDTSVVEIAKRAGVTTRTFFRYFSDKRGVLFADLDDLRTALLESVHRAADTTEPLRVVVGALVEFDWDRLGSRDLQRKRHAVIAANPELLERDLVKHHGMEVGFAEALRQRGVEADAAQLAARIGIHAFRMAYGRWLAADDDASLATITEDVMVLLSTIVPARAAAGAGTGD